MEWNPIHYDKDNSFWLEDHPELFVYVLTQPEGCIFDPQPYNPWLKIQVSKLPEFVLSNPSLNIWRSWDVFAKNKDKFMYVGSIPLLIDIDDENMNISDAYRLTCTCLEVIFNQYQFPKECVRVIFSGRKGFHIEIKPKTKIEGKQFRNELISKVGKIAGDDSNIEGWNIFWESTTLDVFHDFVRVTGSIYSWVDESGQLMKRRVIPLELDTFFNLDLEELLMKTTIS